MLKINANNTAAFSNFTSPFTHFGEEKVTGVPGPKLRQGHFLDEAHVPGRANKQKMGPLGSSNFRNIDQMGTKFKTESALFHS